MLQFLLTKLPITFEILSILENIFFKYSIKNDSSTMAWMWFYLLGSSNAQSLRGKFLARSLAIFLRTLMDADKTRLIEKIMDIDGSAVAENAAADNASSRLAAKTATLNTPEMKSQLEKLKSFKSNKGKIERNLRNLFI